MAINKITPKRLDRSSDFKLIPPGSMVDALNMLITEDETGGDDDTIGDAGVLKNIRGNSNMLFAGASDVIAEGEVKIIGSVTDKKLKIVYFFLWHQTPSEHGVWAYDPFGKLPGGGSYTNAIRKIHKSNLYNFPQHGFVKGDIIYTSQSRLEDFEIKPNTSADFEKDTILYFTDNTNEPRKINVYKALLGEDENYDSLSDNIDFITACPQTPLTPITFEFDADPERTTSNFKSGPGFQFAYQFVYKDGMESAISPYSDIAFPPGIVNQGASTQINHNLHNRCQLTIPQGGEQIEFVKILARQFNNPEMVVLEEVPDKEDSGYNWNSSTRLYSFYNDRVVKGVSTNQVNKQYDNLPRKAEAQAVVDNRLMYGNYLEGFDNVKTGCTSEVIFHERGEELVNFELKFVPAISEQPNAALSNTYTGGENFTGSDQVNKSAGYILDASEIPDVIDAGTNVKVTLVIAPNNNFHIYQAGDSYHQSRHKGAFLNDDGPIDYSQNTAEAGNYDGGEYGLDGLYGHQTKSEAGAQWIHDTHADQGENLTVKTYGSQTIDVPFGIPYGGFNGGVGGFGENSPKWRKELGTGAEFEVVYGTSAANPLILKGGDITFYCDLTFTAAQNDGKKAVVQSVCDALTTGAIGYNNGSGIIINDVQGQFTHVIDLGIQNFEKAPEGSALSELITGCLLRHDDETLTHPIYRNPIGNFIVDKATVKFSLEKDNYYSNLSEEYSMLRLVIDEISNVEVVSAIKKWIPGAPWQIVKLGVNDMDTTSAGYAGSLDTSVGPLQETLVHGDNEGQVINVLPAERNNGWFDYATAQDGIGPGEISGLDYGDFSYRTTQYTDYAQYLIGEQPILLIPGHNVNVSQNAFWFDQNIENNLRKHLQFGFLVFEQNENNSQFFRHNKANAYNEYFEDIQEQGVPTENILPIDRVELFPFSLLDGEGGPSGNLPFNATGSGAGMGLFSYSDQLAGDLPSVGWGNNMLTSEEYELVPHWGEDSTHGHYSFDTPLGVSSVPGRQEFVTAQNTGNTGQNVGLLKYGGPRFLGVINANVLPNLDLYELGNLNDNYEFAVGTPQNHEIDPLFFPGVRTYLPLMQGESFLGLQNSSLPSSLIYSSEVDGDNDGDDTADPWPFDISFDHQHSHLEVIDILFLFDQYFLDQNDQYAVANRSFKTSANHEFGIIYYDQRGRHGFVNHLKTVYVPGYSNQERGSGLQGKVDIRINLEHQPPDWAHFYKIAYTKNTTVQNFVQYSSGGAYVEPDSGENIVNSNLYVSLNYLQESPISYVGSWGARDPEGGLSLFRYIKGANQKLRVISAYDDQTNRTFYYDMEFDIVDIVLLGDTDNPLGDDDDISNNPQKKGEFVIVKNNTLASGFNYTAVRDGSDKWLNNCIIELYTPQRGMEAEDRFYYEIGDTYSVTNPGANDRAHSAESILLDKGDVWWRRVPVNINDFEEGVYTNLISYTDEDGVVAAPNFKSYYLETECANDLFKSDASLIGRPNITFEEAIETRRESSITYSDQSNPNSRIINYSSFNLTLSNFKDLQEEFGNINYICNLEGDVFVIQSDRCTIVPAGKTLFSDVQGSTTVAASAMPLGEEKVIPGVSGCDNNPESVVQVDSILYFAHKTLGKVFRFSPQEGITTISDLGMGSYFRDLFRKAISSSNHPLYDDVRVVGGFHPVRQEYLLTVLNAQTYQMDEDDTVYDDDAVIDLSDEYLVNPQIIDFGTYILNEEFVGAQSNNAFNIINQGNTPLDWQMYFYPVNALQPDVNPWMNTVFGGDDNPTSGLLQPGESHEVPINILVEPNMPQSPSGGSTFKIGIGEAGNPPDINDASKFVEIKAQLLPVGGCDGDGVIDYTDQFQDEVINIQNQGVNYVFDYCNWIDVSTGTFSDFSYNTFLNVLAAQNIQLAVTATGNPYQGNLPPIEELLTNVGNTAEELGCIEEEDTGYVAYTQELCDYPILVNSAGVINAESVNAGYSELLVQLSAGDYTIVSASQIFPDVSDQGFINNDSLNSVLSLLELTGGEIICTIVADINDDGVVDGLDLIELIENMGNIGDNLPGDLNNDGAVSNEDLLILLTSLGGQISGSIDDLINPPDLNLEEFAQVIVANNGITPEVLSTYTTYYDLFTTDLDISVSSIQSNFLDVYNYIVLINTVSVIPEGADPFLSDNAGNIFTQVYLVDEQGEFIPFEFILPPDEDDSDVVIDPTEDGGFYASWDGTTEALCNFPAIVDESGFITSESTSSAVSLLISQVNEGSITTEQLSDAFPTFDKNGDGLINILDVLAIASEIEALTAEEPINCNATVEEEEEEEQEQAPYVDWCSIPEFGGGVVTAGVVVPLYTSLGPDEFWALFPAGVAEFVNYEIGTLSSTYFMQDDPDNPNSFIPISYQCETDEDEIEEDDEIEGEDEGDPPVVSVMGCTDPEATNYNPEATLDDGSCTYPPPPPEEVTAPVIDWCSVPGIEFNSLGNIGYSEASAVWNSSGAGGLNPQPFFDLFPEEVGEYWLNNPDAFNSSGSVFFPSIFFGYYFGNAADGFIYYSCE